MRSQYEVRFVRAKGERKVALQALRVISGRPVTELADWLDQGASSEARVVFTGWLEDARAVVRQHGELLELQLWTDGGREAASEPAVGPYRVERGEVARDSSRMGVRFAVDDVVPAKELLPTEDAGLTWTRLVEGEVVHHETPQRLVTSKALHVHPLAHSVQCAFDDHRPLRISPDAVWLTITTGFALHVEHNAEALRGRFVSHAGRRTLAVPDEGSWPERIDAFAGLLASELGEGRRRLFTCDFSTSTAVDKTASEVVMMGAFKAYFDYLLVAVCGIPEVELLGTVDDWRTIRARIEILAEYDLEAWVAALRPLADEWIETAAGRPDRNFWRAIYKPKEVYGASEFRGWLTQLFPYLTEGLPNPTIGSGGPHTHYIYDAVTVDSLPSGRTLAPVRTTRRQHFELAGGLAGVAQDEDGWLQAVSGWAVVARPLGTLIARIEEARDPEPESQTDTASDTLDVDGDELDWRLKIPPPCPAELLELSARLGSFALHGGRWHVRATADRARRPEVVEGEITLLSEFTVFADLRDGRQASCGAVYPIRGAGAGPDWWVVILREDEVPTDETPVVAKGVRQFLERVLDENDLPFFDVPGFMPESTLAETKQW